MAQNQFELIISPGTRPLWRTIVSALFFTATLFLIYFIASPFFYVEITEKLCMVAAKELSTIAFTITGGIHFGLTKGIMIDTDQNKLISRYELGPFSKDVMSEVPELEYVAVFLNVKEIYEVNLWYKGNKHYNMYTFEQKIPAFKFAEMVRERLKIDLLDATVKGDSKWLPKVQA